MTGRRLRFAAAAVAWVAFYCVVLATADQRPDPVTAVVRLIIPPVLWVALVQIGSATDRLLLRRRSFSAEDLPGWLLAIAVAALPGSRREWGEAMTAELSEVHGRAARRRFALSSVRATVLLPPAGGWPMVVLVTAAVVTSVVAAGRAAAPGLTVFAATFTALLGTMVILAVARAQRPRPQAPALVVVTGVAASVAATAFFLHREPAAAQHLPPPAAAYLAVALAACLWIAAAPSRWLRTSRLAARLGAAAATVFAAWFLLVIRLDGWEPPAPLVPVLGAALVLIPVAVFVLPAVAAARAGRSLRAGAAAAVWTVVAAIPLTYAAWLPESLRRHAIDGRTLDGELLAPAAANLSDALVFCLGVFPLLGLSLGLVGAVAGTRRTPASGVDG